MLASRPRPLAVAGAARASVAFACVACAACGASSARVVEGAAYVGAAETAMRSEGIVFAPFELPMPSNPQGEDAYRCIDSVNRAASEALAARYQLRAAPPSEQKLHGVP